MDCGEISWAYFGIRYKVMEGCDMVVGWTSSCIVHYHPTKLSAMHTCFRNIRFVDVEGHYAKQALKANKGLDCTMLCCFRGFGFFNHD